MTWPPVTTEAVRPSVGEVSRLTRTRTVDLSGNELDEFNDQTRPTGDQVEELIDAGTDDILARLPLAFDPVLYNVCRRVIALRVALLIELSFFREYSSSTAPGLASLFNEDLLALQARAHGGPVLQASQGPPPPVV